MSLFNLPSPLDKTFADTDDLPVFFDRLMEGMVELLQCDLCYFYLRDPQRKEGQILHAHSVRSEIPNFKQAQKQTEDFYLSQTDPFFAAALNCEPAIFIEDLQTVGKIKDKEFCQEKYPEQKALIQAHICMKNELWGILQASQFSRPRSWTEFDRSLISLVSDKIAPLVSIYSQRKIRDAVQYIHDGNC